MLEQARGAHQPTFKQFVLTQSPSELSQGIQERRQRYVRLAHGNLRSNPAIQASILQQMQFMEARRRLLVADQSVPTLEHANKRLVDVQSRLKNLEGKTADNDYFVRKGLKVRQQLLMNRKRQLEQPTFRQAILTQTYQELTHNINYRRGRYAALVQGRVKPIDVGEKERIYHRLLLQEARKRLLITDKNASEKQVAARLQDIDLRLRSLEGKTGKNDRYIRLGLQMRRVLLLARKQELQKPQQQDLGQVNNARRTNKNFSTFYAEFLAEQKKKAEEKKQKEQEVQQKKTRKEQDQLAEEKAKKRRLEKYRVDEDIKGEAMCKEISEEMDNQHFDEVVQHIHEEWQSHNSSGLAISIQKTSHEPKTTTEETEVEDEKGEKSIIITDIDRSKVRKKLSYIYANAKENVTIKKELSFGIGNFVTFEGEIWEVPPTYKTGNGNEKKEIEIDFDPDGFWQQKKINIAAYFVSNGTDTYAIPLAHPNARHVFSERLQTVTASLYPDTTVKKTTDEIEKRKKKKADDEEAAKKFRKSGWQRFLDWYDVSSEAPVLFGLFA